MFTRYTATLALGLIALLSQGCADEGTGNDSTSSSQSLLGDEDVTLGFMREEEKLARDVYNVLHGKWGVPIFANIASSEQTHMNLLNERLDAYGLDDPVQGTGQFSDSSLQSLYNNLVLRGDESLLEALHVGAMVEELDIEDLRSAIAGSTRADVQDVYHVLMAGSVNHLSAFVQQIENRGVDYRAQAMSQSDVDALVGGDRGSQGQQFGQNR